MRSAAILRCEHTSCLEFGISLEIFQDSIEIRRVFLAAVPLG